MNIMLDLETLGTSPGCAILSIAAVPFSSPYHVEPFYVKIAKDSCTALDLHIDPATEAWWSKQGADARKEAFSGTVPITRALLDFADYYDSLPVRAKVWGNGADFDNVILAAIYKKLGMPQPWKYTDSRCYRTLKALYPAITGMRPIVAHHALYDAKAQAAHATTLLTWSATRRGEQEGKEIA